MANQVVRTPRYARWLVTGGVLGVLAAFVLAATAGGDERYGFRDVALYLAMLGGLIGALAGGGVAVLLDRSGRRRP